MNKDYDRRYRPDNDGWEEDRTRFKYSDGMEINMRSLRENNAQVSERNANADPRRRRRRKKKNHNFLKRIFIVFLAIAILLLILFGIALIAFPTPKQTVVLLAGTDESGTRTDTIMLGVINVGKNVDITLLSIPRDTYVTVSDKNYKKMCESYPEPGNRNMKINAVHHFAGEQAGMQMLAEEVERNFGVDIDYYAKVDFEAFAYLVDSIGGVNFNVPMNMDYEDPLQELKIHLKAGEQMIDGNKAEQLMRFRSGYATQDLGRIQVQQEFMRALITEAIKPKNILKNRSAYTTLCDEYMETNFKMGEAIHYIRCMFKLGKVQLNAGTMPGDAGNRGGQAVYVADIDEFENLYGDKYLER